jgi:hypothetical protein
MKRRLLILSLSAALIALGLWACRGENLSGTSVTIGNPTKVGLTFVDPNSAISVRISGHLGVYSPRQIAPWDSLPLLSYRLINQDSFILTGELLRPVLSIPTYDSIIQSDSGAFEFNLHITSSSNGSSLLKKLKYLVSENRFVAENMYGSARMPVFMESPVSVRGTVDISELARNPNTRGYYAYIPGSPIFSKLDSTGHYSLTVPRGMHEVLLAVLTPENPQSGVHPVVRIFAFNDSLSANSPETLVPSRQIDSLYQLPP